MSGDSVGATVLVTPPPTPNGPLHLGHLSGPYVAADVAARVARARGERVVTMTGIDYHQNYVLAKARAAQRPAEAVAAGYTGQIRDVFAAARIDYDVLIDPAADADYRAAVTELFTGLLDDLPLEPARMAGCEGCGRTMHHAYVTGSCPVCGAGSNGGTCEGCGSFTTALNLVDAACTGCGGAPRRLPESVPVLRLEAFRGRLLEIWSQTDLPPRVWRLIRHHLAAGLPDVVLSYPTDWGIELSAAAGTVAGQRLDVWAEMALGYAYAVARAVDETAVRARPVTAATCAKAWQGVDRLWFFEGIDNAFYYAIMFPALLDAVGVPAEKVGLVVNEFYRLTGAKFSTSRDHAVWAHEFLQQQDPGLLRLYLSWDRPDRHESDFNPPAYREFADWATKVLAGEAAVLPPGLAAAELARAETAVELAGFDAPLAARCLLAGRAADPARADRLLAAFTGADHAE